VEVQKQVGCCRQRLAPCAQVHAAAFAEQHVKDGDDGIAHERHHEEGMLHWPFYSCQGGACIALYHAPQQLELPVVHAVAGQV
jgi:hypothetical protein